MIVCISREIHDWDVLGQGIATPLVACGYALAKLTHAQHAIFEHTIGNTHVWEFKRPLLMSKFEKWSIGHALDEWSFCEAWDSLHGKGREGRAKEWFRPAQIDPYGNFNNIVIGDYHSSIVRLPGSAGIPDVTPFYKSIYIYVPRHERRVFVEKIDFISGVGFLQAQKPEERLRMEIVGQGPKIVVTDLCVLGFDEKTKRMKIISLHAGVTVEEVKRNTAFDLITPEKIRETTPPTKDQIKMIREKIDPMEIRRLELLSGEERLRKIKEIYEKETFLSC